MKEEGEIFDSLFGSLFISNSRTRRSHDNRVRQAVAACSFLNTECLGGEKSIVMSRNQLRHTRTYWTPYEQNSNMKPNACLPFTYILMSFSQNSVTLKLEPGATRSANSAEDRMSRLAGSSFDSIFTRRNTCWEFELSKKESFNKKSQTFDL